MCAANASGAAANRERAQREKAHSAKVGNKNPECLRITGHHTFNKSRLISFICFNSLVITGDYNDDNFLFLFLAIHPPIITGLQVVITGDQEINFKPNHK